jgi:transposase
MQDIYVVGIDLAKEIFQIHGNDKYGRCVGKKRLTRKKMPEFLASLPKCIVAMEACGGSSYWARKSIAAGHEVRLISPQFVKPFVKSNKNDAADAEAIAEAAVRPNMRFVAMKSADQQDLQILHRVRERMVKERTAIGNQIRGFLQEYGLVTAKGILRLRKDLPVMIANDKNELTPMTREMLLDLSGQLRVVDERVGDYDRKILQISRKSEICKRLEKIPGIGPMTSTAVMATVGDPKVFKNGRQFSAFIGLVPKQHSSGGKSVLLGISKRGDVYLRKLLIHGARAVIRYCDTRDDARSRWVQNLVMRCGKNKAAVALANKNARTVWVLMATGHEYDSSTTMMNQKVA